MDIKSLVSNIVAICILILLFLMAFTWIIFEFNSHSSSLKDSLSIVSSLFGGIAALAAAYIASRLFNDWKEQHNKQILASEAKDNFKLIHKERDFIFQLKFTCEDLSQNKLTEKVSWDSFATVFENGLINLYNINKDIMSSFYFLSKGQDIYKLMLDYHSEIEKVANFLFNEQAKPYSQTTFITSQMAIEVLELMQGIETKNSDVLDGLKKYIFVK